VPYFVAHNGPEGVLLTVVGMIYYWVRTNSDKQVSGVSTAIKYFTVELSQQRKRCIIKSFISSVKADFFVASVAVKRLVINLPSNETSIWPWVVELSYPLIPATVLKFCDSQQGIVIHANILGANLAVVLQHLSLEHEVHRAR
jgi:hypothetical protein